VVTPEPATAPLAIPRVGPEVEVVAVPTGQEAVVAAPGSLASADAVPAAGDGAEGTTADAVEDVPVEEVALPSDVVAVGGGVVEAAGVPVATGFVAGTVVVFGAEVVVVEDVFAVEVVFGATEDVFAVVVVFGATEDVFAVVVVFGATEDVFVVTGATDVEVTDVDVGTVAPVAAVPCAAIT
jgi:hypothetical protein